VKSHWNMFILSDWRFSSST